MPVHVADPLKYTVFIGYEEAPISVTSFLLEK
jgi:hypothetical protein